MMIGKWQEEELAGRNLATLAGRRLKGAAARHDQMESADVAQMRQWRLLIVGSWGNHSERRREAGVQEDRPGQPHGDHRLHLAPEVHAPDDPVQHPRQHDRSSPPHDQCDAL
jgi:hypothetical protein